MDGIVKNSFKLLSAQKTIYQFSRSLVILERRNPVQLQKKNSKQKPVLKGRHFVYDVVENLDIKKKENIDVILTSFIEGLGHKGEIVSVKPSFAYDHLLLPQLAVYASPENIENMKNNLYVARDEEKPSSIYSLKTMKYLQNMVLGVCMNKDEPWTIEKWHIRVALRKMNIHVLNDDCIEIPKKPISGPNLTLEGKSFISYVTINKKERAAIQCRVHHWSTKLADRLPYQEFFYLDSPDPIFPEEKELLESLRANKKAKA
ncbi:39S ribosomal protein L9, mitochondrial [Daktulosphaira vitifoliae]|uniref:39S ribosomal protein L9, mitochondrial n=1 Tax=Daktulosphaira vitifoliae TaxID=58002 RepID=UPI0021A98217|nr:39S ribosomal protein L9, mitochondrial [Daktulosphaira vitifoliae]